MKIWLGPSGGLIRGHVLDCALGPFREKLRDLDQQLYVKWNPKKLKGWGLWEVRRRPNLKKIKETVVAGGTTFHVIDYVENNFENHILEVPFLNYNIITKLKAIDTWSHTHGTSFQHEMEYREDTIRKEQEAKALAERKYELKQNRSAVRDLMDYTLSGGDPSQIANHWNTGSQD